MKINFQESTKTIRNPEMGYPTFASWQDMKKDGIGSGQNFKSNLEHEERIKNLHGFTNLLYTLTDFTKNGGGADIPITEAALRDLAAQLDLLASRGAAPCCALPMTQEEKRIKSPKALT